MGGAQQQRAIGIERFGAAADLSFANSDHQIMTDRCAMLFPFICQVSWNGVCGNPL